MFIIESYEYEKGEDINSATFKGYLEKHDSSPFVDFTEDIRKALKIKNLHNFPFPGIIMRMHERPDGTNKWVDNIHKWTGANGGGGYYKAIEVNDDDVLNEAFILNRRLNEALFNEKYEEASVLRDAISKLKKEEKCS